MRGVDLDARGLFCIQACFHSRCYTGKGGGEPLARTSRQPDLSPAYHLRANCKFCCSYCSRLVQISLEKSAHCHLAGGGARLYGYMTLENRTTFSTGYPGEPKRLAVRNCQGSFLNKLTTGGVSLDPIKSPTPAPDLLPSSIGKLVLQELWTTLGAMPSAGTPLPRGATPARSREGACNP